MTKSTKDPKTLDIDTVSEPKRRTRKKAQSEQVVQVSATHQEQGVDDKTATQTTQKKRSTRKTSGKRGGRLVAKETFLEFIEHESGVLMLREMGSDEPLISIEFAEKIKEMIGQENIQVIGQHMIQAAIASFMQRQMNQWHAHVHEETPKRFS